MNNELVKMFDGYDVRLKEKDETWLRANDIGKVLFPESKDSDKAINRLVNSIETDYKKQFVAEGTKMGDQLEVNEAIPYDPEIEELLPRETKFKEKHVSGSKYASYINKNMLNEILFRTNSPIALKFKLWVFKILKDIEKHRSIRGEGIDTRKRLTSAIKKYNNKPKTYANASDLVNIWAGIDYKNDRDKLEGEKLKKVKDIEESLAYLFENHKATWKNLEALKNIYKD
jgi:prophage antirepressor-like protein